MQSNDSNVKYAKMGAVICLSDGASMILEAIQKSLTRCCHRLARWENPIWVALSLKLFIKAFPVNVDEAKETDLTKYASFDAFFTRALAKDARPFEPNDQQLISPVDGIVMQDDLIQDVDALVQAKGKTYALSEFAMLDQQSCQRFVGGRQSTIYLAPYHYHRVHMPISGKLTAYCHVPGMLFSVSPKKVNRIDKLFARNERLIMQFDTPHGPMLLVMVAACLVRSISSRFLPDLIDQCLEPETWQQPSKPIHFDQGAELGCFHYGSTVVLLHACSAWSSNIQPGQPLRLAQAIHQIHKNSTN
jgi:phosphatidylserine decarboxylase